MVTVDFKRWKNQRRIRYLQRLKSWCNKIIVLYVCLFQHNIKQRYTEVSFVRLQIFMLVLDCYGLMAQGPQVELSAPNDLELSAPTIVHN